MRRVKNTFSGLLPKERYGQWAGNPKGRPYDPERCAWSVYDDHLFRQCAKKRGHGAQGLFCKQHAKKHARFR